LFCAKLHFSVKAGKTNSFSLTNRIAESDICR
jgi:hypothetical protein